MEILCVTRRRPNGNQDSEEDWDGDFAESQKDVKDAVQLLSSWVRGANTQGRTCGAGRNYTGMQNTGCSAASFRWSPLIASWSDIH